jgi:hypothetical protein
MAEQNLPTSYLPENSPDVTVTPSFVGNNFFFVTHNFFSCLHPGAVFTSIWDFPTGKIKPIADHLRRIFDFAGFWVMRTPLEGISDIMLLCTTQDRELYNGKYLMSMKPQETNKYGKSETLAKELWTKSEEIVKKFTL